MRVLGISNPEFIGVTVATKAICTAHYPVKHLDNDLSITQTAEVLFRQKPDLLIVGGWSRGYLELLTHIRRFNRKFPIICVQHGTVFHRQVFNDGLYKPSIDKALSQGVIDLMGYVHPGESRYQKECLRKPKTLWVPHASPASPMEPTARAWSSHVRIGALGGMSNVLKAVDGAVQIAQAWATDHPEHRAEVVSQFAYDKPHAEFLGLLASCHALLHLSWLECYPNILQEAWAYGVPTLAGPASLGLLESPLLETSAKDTLQKLTVKSTNDAYEVYRGLDYILSEGLPLKRSLWEIQRELHRRTSSHLWEMFEMIREGFHNHSLYDAELFRLPCSELPTESPQIKNHHIL